MIGLTFAAAPCQAFAVLPAEDGQLGVWLVAGPLHTAAAEAAFDAAPTPEARKPLPPPWGAVHWRLLSHPHGALDLKRALRVGTPSGPEALLGGVLKLESALDAFLLISVDGSLSVSIDGKAIWSRSSERLRGHAWDVIPVELSEGSHTLLLRLKHPGRHWAVAFRVLEQETLLPPKGFQWELPGGDAGDVKRLQNELLESKLTTTLNERGYTPKLTLSYRTGLPVIEPLPVQIEQSSAPHRSWEAGMLSVGPRGVHPLTVSLPPLSLESLPEHGALRVRFEARVGTASTESSLWVDRRLPALFARASVVRSELPSLDLMHAQAVDTTLEHLTRKLSKLSVTGSLRELSTTRQRLEHWLDALEHGKDPLKAPGWLRLATRSPLDQRPQPMLVHVPSSFKPGGAERYPLVVLLHGYNGTPEGITRAFLDRKSETAHPNVDGFTVAPHAHGNSFYRGPGEYEVMRVLEWMKATYPIDPLRVSISGVSMGGTGTAQIALRYSDQFSAAAPLCGYHSYFHRRDTSGRTIRPWEVKRMHHWSTASWAERGLHLPLFVAHGTKDYPLENSRVLIRRYQELGYDVTAEWPDTGHAVWNVAYAGARMWPKLTAFVRDPEPSEIVVQTDSLRYGRHAWATITQLRTAGRGKLHVKVASPQKLTATTQNLGAFELKPPKSKLDRLKPIQLEVDARVLTFAPEEALQVHHTKDGWLKGPAPRGKLTKRAGLEGPIRDAFLGPVVFSYGSLDPSTLRANREVATALSRWHDGADVHFPVLADRDLSPKLEREASVVAVGTARDHRLLKAVGSALPITVLSDRIKLGDKAFHGSHLGTAFIYPNPRAPERYLVVVSGTSAAGVWQALSLPRLLPDFLVYDEKLGAAAHEQVLGEAQVLAGGFFDNQWALPKQPASD